MMIEIRYPDIITVEAIVAVKKAIDGVEKAMRKLKDALSLHKMSLKGNGMVYVMEMKRMERSLDAIEAELTRNAVNATVSEVFGREILRKLEDYLKRLEASAKERDEENRPMLCKVEMGGKDEQR